MENTIKNLRDHLAAAALAGLLARGDDESFSYESYSQRAYRWADAMLRERGNAVSDNCNQPEIPCPVKKTLPKEKRAEVSRAKPVAWGVKDGREFAELCKDKEEAIGAAKYYGGCTIVPLYRHPQPTLTDAEREAVDAAMRSSPFCFTPEAKTLDALLHRLK